MNRQNPRDPFDTLLLLGGLGLVAYLAYRHVSQQVDWYPPVTVTHAGRYYDEIRAGRIYGGGAGGNHDVQ